MSWLAVAATKRVHVKTETSFGGKVDTKKAVEGGEALIPLFCKFLVVPFAIAEFGSEEMPESLNSTFDLYHNKRTQEIDRM